MKIKSTKKSSSRSSVSSSSSSTLSRTKQRPNSSSSQHPKPYSRLANAVLKKSSTTNANPASNNTSANSNSNNGSNTYPTPPLLPRKQQTKLSEELDDIHAVQQLLTNASQEEFLAKQKVLDIKRAKVEKLQKETAKKLEAEKVENELMGSLLEGLGGL